jgi:hypothetical protein
MANSNATSFMDALKEAERQDQSKPPHQSPHNNGRPNSQPPQRQPETNRSTNGRQQRTGMSDTAWGWVFSITEWALDFIKGVMLVGGIVGANLADFVMGSLGVSLIVNNRVSQLTFLDGFGFGAILSMGASAIQIYMWSLIQKRGIGANMLLNPKRWKMIPQDVRGFLWTALFLWVIDTILDVSPTFVLFTSENFTGMMELYYVLIVCVMVIVVILCGFAEILTSNMRTMLRG